MLSRTHEVRWQWYMRIQRTNVRQLVWNSNESFWMWSALFLRGGKGWMQTRLSTHSRTASSNSPMQPEICAAHAYWRRRRLLQTMDLQWNFWWVQKISKATVQKKLSFLLCVFNWFLFAALPNCIIVLFLFYEFWTWTNLTVIQQKKQKTFNEIPRNHIWSLTKQKSFHKSSFPKRY